jgi:hypothetical protein
MKRKILHDRNVHCLGYLRDDNLWDIEGHLVDTKTYNFKTNYRGEVTAGTPVHDMSIRITLNNDLKILDIDLDMSSMPYQSCPAIIPNFNKLIGVEITSGFRKKVREIVGGIQGCTHMVELLFPMATTAFQTIYSYKNKNKKMDIPKLINSCHSWSDKGDVIKKEYPKYYKG